MFKNYLKIALRNIRKHKGYSFINIAGLAIGMAACILILLWVQDELSYDWFHKNADQIYRVVFADETYDQIRHYSVTPPALAKAMKKDFAEIIQTTRFDSEENMLVLFGENKFKATVGFTDAEIFAIFTIPFVKGNPQTALKNKNSVVITEKIAAKFFGQEDPINKVITLNNQIDFSITGIIKDAPSNSSLQFELLTQFEHLEELTGQGNTSSWQEFGFKTYVLLTKHTSIPDFNKKISDFLLKSNKYTWKPRLYVQPLTDIHLHDLNGGGMIVYVYIFSIIATFILFIACINFMNLATARAAIRSREIGLRKVVGATKLKLVLQFYGESIFMSFLSLFVSLILVELLLPIFNDLSGKTMSLNLTVNFQLFIFLAGITLITGIVSGSYPALFLSSIQPITTLKGSRLAGSSFLRKTLVVFQFTLSIILIIATIVVSNQLEYIRNQDLGFNKEHVLFVPLNRELKPKFDAVKNELLQNPQVLTVTATSNKIGIRQLGSTDLNKWEGNNGEKALLLNMLSTSYDFLETFDIEMAAGRYFSKEFVSDTAGVILNETAIKEMGLENPIGKHIFEDNPNIIIGVVKDFNFESLHSKIKPLGLFLVSDWYEYIAVKIKAEDIPATLGYIKKVNEKFAPGFPFEYQFLDEEFDNMYRSEQRAGKIFNYFSILAIVISCLGLFGLSTFMIERRIKEVAIRKVIGATVPNLILLNFKEFIRWILIANLFAWPVAWFIMKKWLQDFAYQVNIGILVFIFSATLVLLIALVTVSYQSIKAALANPVESLRYE